MKIEIESHVCCRVWKGLNYDSYDELTDFQRDRYHLFDVPVTKYWTKVTYNHF